MQLEELLAEIRKQLLAAVDPAYREGARNYFTEPIDNYGVRTPQVRKIASAAYRKWKNWPRAERDALCESLWESGKMEEGSVAIVLYSKVAKACGGREFRLFERWLNRYVTNWAHCDGVSSWLVAGCIANEPSLIDRLPAWTRSRNRWKRRAAAVSLLQEAKAGRHTERVFEIAGLLLDDRAGMVRKGVGWLLKEAYPRRPSEVVEFLAPRRDRPARLLLRYAAEKMSARDRERVLG